VNVKMGGKYLKRSTIIAPRSRFEPVLTGEVDAKVWIFLVQSDVAYLFKHLLYNCFLETTIRAID
jgi:hypothetical protein